MNILVENYKRMFGEQLLQESEVKQLMPILFQPDNNGKYILARVDNDSGRVFVYKGTGQDIIDWFENEIFAEEWEYEQTTGKYDSFLEWLQEWWDEENSPGRGEDYFELYTI
jgi:hypothetical protein